VAELPSRSSDRCAAPELPAPIPRAIALLIASSSGSSELKPKAPSIHVSLQSISAGLWRPRVKKIVEKSLWKLAPRLLPRHLMQIKKKLVLLFRGPRITSVSMDSHSPDRSFRRFLGYARRTHLPYTRRHVRLATRRAQENRKKSCRSQCFQEQY